ncbi:hypothetical protein H0E87_001289 [Populus deltoides]|uniref:Uncharacterized protein n=1 Tax=Populus deltoides TaxID=3696 RepID=A0A8T2ZR57_POPDE|nr:hypothetical protein H0E87_001289 [Populus deltoides]
MRSRPQTPPLSKPEDDTDPMTRPAPASTTTSLNVLFPSSRKKGTGVRPCLLLDSTGQAQAIITAQEVLLLNSRDPSVTPFVEELQGRLMFHYHPTKAQEGNGEHSKANPYHVEEPESNGLSPENFPEGFSHYQDCNEGAKQGLENRDGSKVLPFDFVALEACLEAACSCLESEAKTLEQEEHPALDKLTSKISTLNLECLEDSSTSSLNEGDGMDDDDLQADLDDSIPAEVSLGVLEASTSHEDDINNIENEHDHLFSAPNGLGRYSCVHTSTT